MGCEDTQVKSELAQASTENIKLQDVVKSLKIMYRN